MQTDTHVGGFGGDGVCWETTPDGRDGFATLLLREGYPTYVLDLPGRGDASRTSNEVTVKPVADEEFWFDIWRMGLWPKWNEGIQFPKDSLSVSNFFRQMVPDLSDHKLDVAALDAMAQKIGIKGNSHFLMQELNNDVIAVHVANWLKDNNLSD